MACDRIAVMSRGRITGILAPQEATAERLGLLMAGARRSGVMLGSCALLSLKGVWAILAALVVGAGLIRLGGSDPITAYRRLFSGAFFEYHGFATTLVKMSPMLLAGFAVAVPLRAGLFNIGAEGQIYFGALFATWPPCILPDIPGWIHIIICSLAGMVGGGLWALLPGYLKAYHGINEVIVTLLMNYIGINLVSYFVSGPMMEEGAPYPYSVEIDKSLWLPHILPGTDAHLGVVIGIAMAILLSRLPAHLLRVFDERGRPEPDGGTLRRHVGAPAYRLVAGLAVARSRGSPGPTRCWASNTGYSTSSAPATATTGSWSPSSATAIRSMPRRPRFFLGGLRSGANIMQRAVGVPTTVVDAIQGLVIIFVAASLAFRFEQSRWAELWRRRKELDKALEAPAPERPPAPEGAER